MNTSSLANTRGSLAITLEMPAPTAWPIVLAFGTTLLFAGLVTSASISILGAVLMVVGAVGWFRDVLPHEAHEAVVARAGARAGGGRGGGRGGGAFAAPGGGAGDRGRLAAGVAADRDLSGIRGHQGWPG